MALERCRRTARSEHGFTLLEVIVSLALLGVVAGAVAAAFGISFKVVAPGQAQDRLAGAHDQERVEQNLGQDVARAACIQVGGGTVYPANCTHGFANATVAAACTASTTMLCVGWPDVAESSCHIAAYSNSVPVSIGGGAMNSSGLIRRKEYKVVSSNASALGASGLTTDKMAVAIALPAASGSQSVLGTPSGETNQPNHQWVLTLYATVTAKGVASAPAQPVVTHPVSTDPVGQAAQITASGPPC